MEESACTHLRGSGLEFPCIVYGITPPKAHHPEEKLQEIARIQKERLAAVTPDALVVYDIQDESSRNTAARPFPFLETLKPEDYYYNRLSGMGIPGIIYHSIASQSEADFREWLTANRPDMLVLVGAAASTDQHQLSLQRAYSLKKELAPNLALGGILIPERHSRKGDEHLRAWSKAEAGCSFFITQCVYDLQSAIAMLSDYDTWMRSHGKQTLPVIFTLTPCGSQKTLEFMRWLGIAIPERVYTELEQAADMLECSLEICRKIASALSVFCTERRIPFGFNIESVSIRRQEIEASMQLASDVRLQLPLPELIG